MLSTLEKLIFLLATAASLYGASRVILRISRILRRGQGQIDWSVVPGRLLSVLLKTTTFAPVFRARPLASFFHALVGWGFIYYLLVNLGDLLEGFLPNYRFLGAGMVGNLYRLGGDLLSVAVLCGMTALAVRRFVLRPAELNARADIFLLPEARTGIRRDSSIVTGFILIHVGARFAGQSFRIAAHGQDVWQPAANALAALWRGWPVQALVLAEHLAFWFALGTILAFVPYFLYSKHIHLIMAPLNLLLKPQRRSIGELSRLNFEDESVERFGALHLEDLGWEQILDAYACIMCYRCQEVCPAYNTGKVLSPAALEINKRYYLNKEGARLARGEASQKTLLEIAIPPEAVWACTACGACIEICPVGNEPMRDILDIRRALVLMENDFPAQLQTTFRGMERTANPWSLPAAERLSWARGLKVPTIEQNPEPEVLWWVGCAPATDVRAQKTARAFAQILEYAGVNFAVLGQAEQCTGDAARRAGNEYLFNELATANVELLNTLAPKRIVTTCPHCLHTLKNEYPAFGGHYQVVHHSQLIWELIQQGKLRFAKSAFSDGEEQGLTFHDPCYLGRHNGIVAAPRQVLGAARSTLVEMKDYGRNSFCCGAGGAQMWKEEEHGFERVNMARFRQAQESGAKTLAVACPFCLTMLSDAAAQAQSRMAVLDIAEIVLQHIEETKAQDRGSIRLP
ncbi:MAG: (Fe-S)-binding protein [Anaerolineales bacterium]|nr:(Fe-S)-binding protein [Anaerolineales bacterium]MCS7248396.1 (Fe-S)-binding protein [Anaerolineales bacterium]MDW8162209.1 (Fe-S)-binding protein [Anaerolineales bacterium]MDW8446402.1 (Fe-S)-binding protein [Anaerolineales bacterium]